MPAPYEIRIFGDPVLKQRATEIADVDGTLVRLAEDMVQTMYDAPGIGLAAPQVGVQKRLFVYDLQDGAGPRTVINPTITETHGEWAYDEGCLSVPGLAWEIVLLIERLDGDTRKQALRTIRNLMLDGGLRRRPDRDDHLL